MTSDRSGSVDQPPRLAPNGGKLPRFDPGPSLARAVAVLANDVPFALIGGVALWAYVPASEQRFTKDVDVAYPSRMRARVEAALRAAGHEPLPLEIGGFGVREEPYRIDFIDRGSDFGTLFERAVQEAQAAQRWLDVEDEHILLVAPEYLVAMKLLTGERDDEQDVERLLRASSPPVNLVAARALCAELLGPAVANRLDVIARAIGHPAARKRYKS